MSSAFLICTIESSLTDPLYGKTRRLFVYTTETDGRQEAIEHFKKEKVYPHFIARELEHKK